MNLNIDTAVDALIEAIKADYLNWTSNCYRNADGELSDINKRMIAEFDSSISASAGRKYVKIVTGGSVWGFVVACDDDKKFTKGTILKAAGYATPARNGARGNILAGGYTVQWTGPLYFR
jgi:hypothetical protein